MQLGPATDLLSITSDIEYQEQAGYELAKVYDRLAMIHAGKYAFAEDEEQFCSSASEQWRMQKSLTQMRDGASACWPEPSKSWVLDSPIQVQSARPRQSCILRGQWHFSSNSPQNFRRWWPTALA